MLNIVLKFVRGHTNSEWRWDVKLLTLLDAYEHACCACCDYGLMQSVFMTAAYNCHYESAASTYLLLDITSEY